MCADRMHCPLMYVCMRAIVPDGLYVYMYVCIGLVNRTIAFCGVIGIGKNVKVDLEEFPCKLWNVCMYVCMYVCVCRNRCLVLK